jgi:putative copper resistance protein D
MRGTTGFVTVAVSLGIVIAAVLLVGSAGYSRVSHADPGVATSLTSAMLNLVALLAGALCVSALVRVAFLAPRTGRDRMRVGGDGELDVAMWSALAWCLAAVALVPVDAADANGVPLAAISQPGAFGHLVQGSYLPQAWIVVAVLAGVIAIVCFVAVRWAAVLVCAGLAAVALLAPVLVTEVLVGPNHDFGGDASMYGTPAFAVMVGCVVLAALDRRVVSPLRLRVAVGAAAAFVVASDAVVIPFELAGASLLSTPTGSLFLVKETAVIVAALLVVVPRPNRHTRVRTAAAAVAVGIAVGAVTAMTRIPPPQFFVPTSITQNFLGYDLPAAPSFSTLAFDWRPNILFLVLSVVGTVVYLAAVRRLNRRGDAWPLGRTVAWVLGWVVVVVTTSSGVGPYSGASFSVHMALHMSLNMLAPLLLTLGGVITLLLRATTAHRPSEPAGPHEWLNAVLHSRLFRSANNPLWVFLVFIGSYYALYFTPIFDYAMRYHWSHQLMNVHFLAIGYLFYGLVIGVDAPPRPIPHIGKLGLVLAAMPFHAFFGVAVMTSKDIIAHTFYSYLDLPWMNLRSDQYLGGGIAWSAGELPLIIIVIALVTQWSRSDARLAKRTDRHLDSGIDSSFDAYNEMLTQLAARRPAEPQGPR